MSGPHGESFSGRVGWGTTPAVVVVDLVRAYTQPEGPFALLDVGAAVAATQQLVDAARAHGHLVVWTVVRYAPGLEDATGGWGELTLKPEAGEPVVVKQYASAFFGTSLASTLRVAGVDTVVVTGVSTSGCVRATAHPRCTRTTSPISTPSTPTSPAWRRRSRTSERVGPCRGRARACCCTGGRTTASRC